jgi:photosystem II stability/assembly factor-like uncharacterized protein
MARYKPLLSYRRLLHAFLMLCLLGSIVTQAEARWKRIYKNPRNARAFRAGFFLNEQFGLIGGSGDDGIFVTRDGGQTWSTAVLPGAPPSNVSQILMLDASNGFVTLDAGDGNYPILYKTSTGGATWDAVQLFGSAPDIYVTLTAVIVTNRRDSTVLQPDGSYARVEVGKTYLSFDKGKTFVAGPIMQGNGVDFVDDQHGVVVTYRGHVWFRTTNGGLTWTTLSPIDTGECWGVYGVKGSSTFFTAGENDQSKFGSSPIPHSDVRRSDDYGATWRYVSTMPVRTTGHIAGFGMTLVTQSDTTRKSNGPLTGLYRSTNGGTTWQSIGGPSNVEDTRFIVLGCRGEVIIAFDASGNVWKTDDGGDGSQPQYRVAETSIALDSLKVCLPSDTTVTVTNVGCDTIFITNARSLQSDPDVQFLSANGSPLSLPIAIPPGKTGTVRMRLSRGVAGPITARAEIETTRQGIVSDDTVHLSGNVAFYDPLQALARLRFDSTSICAFSDSVVTFTNPGCQAIHLLSARLSSGKAFTLTPTTLPDSIVSGGTKSFAVRFTPQGLATANDSVIVTYEVFGVQRRIAIPISGNGKPDIAAFELAVDALAPGSPAALEFGTLTRCDLPDTLWFTITNPGCTAMTVAPVQVQDSTHRQILLPTKQIKWQAMAQPASVKAPDKFRFWVSIAPAALGDVRGFVRVTYTLQGAAAKDYFLPYHATVIRGAVALNLSDAQRTFDSIQFCAQKDITIPIVNDGCDTMTVLQRNLISSAFFLTNPKAVPYKIPPHASDIATVRFIPGQSGPANGTLFVTTDADSVPSRTIPIVGFALPTDTISFTAYTHDQVVHAGDTALVLFTTNRSVRNKGVNVVTFVLTYNGDVMTPWPSTARSDIPGANIVVLPEVRIGGKTAKLTINVLSPNMTLDSGKTIGSILFHVTLSDSARTDFHIESITLNNGTGNFAKCVLGSVVDSGTIAMDFQCGDALLYGYLLKQSSFKLTDGLRIRTRSTIPDPVTSTEIAKLPVTVSQPGEYRLHVYTAAGNEAFTKLLQLNAGDQNLPIETASLRSGSHHIVIEDSDGRIVTADFVVTR